MFGLDLSISQPHVLVLELDLVAGAKNDALSMYVDPPDMTIPSTPYLSDISRVGDPGALTGISINQFTTGTQNGFRLGFLSVAAGDGAKDFALVLPEPSGFCALSFLLAVAPTRRRGTAGTALAVRRSDMV